MQKVKDILTELDCGVGIDPVDRAHRIGQRKKNYVDGKFISILLCVFPLSEIEPRFTGIEKS